jgi:hypothetical protein
MNAHGNAGVFVAETPTNISERNSYGLETSQSFRREDFIGKKLVC